MLCFIINFVYIFVKPQYFVIFIPFFIKTWRVEALEKLQAIFEMGWVELV